MYSIFCLLPTAETSWTCISVCDQPPRSTQPGHPFVGRSNEYQPKGGVPCGCRVKAGIVRVWVAGKTMWSPCYTRSERFRYKGLIYKALCKFSSLFFLYFLLSVTALIIWAKVKHLQSLTFLICSQMPPIYRCFDDVDLSVPFCPPLVKHYSLSHSLPAAKSSPSFTALMMLVLLWSKQILSVYYIQ